MTVRGATLGALCALAAGGAALAEPVPLEDAELAEVRGGLMTPIGIDVGFAADIRTYLDGELALETRLVWTDDGVSTQSSGPLGVTATGPGVWSVAVPGAGGSTEILHDLSANRIVAVALNTASGRTLRQDADLTLTLPGLADLQSRIAAARFSQTLSAAVDLGLIRSGGP